MMSLPANIAVAALMAMSVVPSASSQTVTDPMFPPASFEPPEARATSQRTLADCVGKTLDLAVIYDSRFKVQSLVFGEQKIQSSDLVSLNEWMGQLRGNVLTRIWCDHTGASMYFFEAFARDNNPARSLHVVFRDGTIEKLR